MNYLYNESDLNELTRMKKRNLFIFFIFVFLFVASLTIFIVVSSYKTRLLFSILSSVSGFIFVAFMIFFLSKYFYLRRVENEYRTLLESKETIIKCEVLECSEFLTTLPDKSRCYEVLIKKDDKETIYYLSELFDTIKPGKCRLVISYDYIKGYQYED